MTDPFNDSVQSSSKIYRKIRLRGLLLRHLRLALDQVLQQLSPEALVGPF